ncbi:uncharacterized protein [Engystomops pustulosus]|uniref:uncharacterized protein n=1 Tax=Engystomops pustulosus TaxID=76066 RepID=UPI003AFB315F
MTPVTGSISAHNFFDFVATLDHLNLPLLKCCVPAIVTSMEPKHLLIKTSMLSDHLHWLGGRDLANVLNFFSVIVFARPDAIYLNAQLIEKTCKQMVYAEHQGDGDIAREAMMLLLNISSYRFECVIFFLMTYLDCPRYWIMKTLAAISSKHADKIIKHLPEILAKVKSMTEFTIDRHVGIAIYHLMQTFSDILLKEERESERKLFPECIKLIVDVTCVTCPEVHQDRRNTPDQQTSTTTEKPKTVEELIKHKPWPSERSNDFAIHHTLQAHPDTSLTIDEGQNAMFYYVQEILTDKKRQQDLIKYLLPVLQSSLHAANITSTVFFSELLRHPGIIDRKVMTHLITVMMEKASSPDQVERLLAVKALGNATEGSPKFVLPTFLKHVNILFEILQEPRQPIFITEVLKTFSKLSRIMKPKNHQETFHKIIELCKQYMNDMDAAIQAQSLELFVDLAQRYSGSKSQYFKQHVQDCLSTLFIKLHSEDIRIVATGTAALFHSLPFIHCKEQRKLLGGNSSGRTHLWSIYEKIGQKQPNLTAMMILQCVKLLWVVEDRKAVLKHLEMLTDSIPAEELPSQDLRVICRNLNILLYHGNPTREWAVNATFDILSTKWGRDELLRVHPNPEMKEFWRKTYIMCDRCIEEKG